jgi:hypothetical protein
LLKAHPPDLVIISESRWIFTASSAESNVTAQSDSLIRMIQKIPTSTKVVIIEDPPLPTNVDVPNCLSTYLSDYRRCSYTQKVGFGSSMRTREEKASEATGAALIDLTSAICPGTGNCPVVINNMISGRRRPSRHLRTSPGLPLRGRRSRGPARRRASLRGRPRS